MEGLTNQEKTFVKEIVKTGNKTQSAKKAFEIKDENYAHVKGSRLIRKDTIKNAIQTLADRIPDDKLHEVMMEGLQATKQSGTGGMKIGINKGEVTDFGHTDIEYPDYAVRHKYLDSAYKLKGAYETDENKSINVLMPILVRFLDIKEDEGNSN